MSAVSATNIKYGGDDGDHVDDDDEYDSDCLCGTLKKCFSHCQSLKGKYLCCEII